MLSRKEHEQKATHLPEEWRKKVRELLNSTYGNKFDKEKNEFAVFGMTFPAEVVLAVSLVNKKDDNAAPVTYHVSTDLNEKIKADKVVDNLVDSVGIFFDSYFEDPNWNDFFSKWEETEFKGIKIYYKISRENVGLTLLADQILEESDQEN